MTGRKLRLMTLIDEFTGQLKSLAKQKTGAKKIAKALNRTPGPGALPPQLLQLNQCNRNTPSTACSSAGLMSFECATVTANSGPSSDFSQNARKSFSAGKFGNIS